MGKMRIADGLAAASLFLLPLCASPQALAADDIFEMSLEELSDISISSVSKFEEKASSAAAAVYVLSKEDIRRSGVTSVPELLRLVPGIHVARVSSSRWAISIRGFNGIFSNKLLVLIDGRSVYNQTFAGVYWDQVDLLLEDVEQIEVIRGPGASVWGNNAVNGVINIITKNAADTQGAYLTAGGGNEDELVAGGRYGWQIDDKRHVRVYTKTAIRDASDFADGPRSFDAWKSFLLGFRHDMQPTADDSISIHADGRYLELNDVRTDVLLRPPFAVRNNNNGRAFHSSLQGRWRHVFTPTSELNVQAFADISDRDDPTLPKEEVETYDFDIQHRFALSNRQTISWGTGYRHVEVDLFENDFSIRPTFNSPSMHQDIYSAFVQDEISLFDGRLHFTAGAKLDYNNFTELELQPSARLAYTPAKRYTLWASYSRAVRVPTIIDRSLQTRIAAFPGEDGSLTELELRGDKGIESEVLNAYEIGFRAQPRHDVTIDITAFINSYQDLRIFEAQRPVFLENPDRVSIAQLATNNGEGETYGGEAVISWQPIPWWRLQAWYAYLDLDVGETFEDEAPENQALLRSLMTVQEVVEIDPTLRFVDSISEAEIDSYLELDLRLAYLAAPGLELSLVGRNLLDSRHEELEDSAFRPRAVERSVFAKVDWRFGGN